MRELLRKTDQYQTTIFGGRFVANKPVASRTKPSTAPYSSLFYWSHAYALEECEFGLHPHEGFEIMTFVLAGSISHYDTETRVWTDLKRGDFQIIQSNRGISHQERVSKGTRAFQIWFDPGFRRTISLEPSYTDYAAGQFLLATENGVQTITYAGQNSPTFIQTPDLTIQKLIFQQRQSVHFAREPSFIYTFYGLDGSFRFDGYEVRTDDVYRIRNENHTLLECVEHGELLLIRVPADPGYEVVR